MRAVQLPNNEKVPFATYFTTKTAVEAWLEKSVTDTAFLALVVDVSAYSRNGQSNPSTESKVLMNDWKLTFPLHRDTRAVIAACLKLHDGQLFWWDSDAVTPCEM
jgi:hypothetical protein